MIEVIAAAPFIFYFIVRILYIKGMLTGGGTIIGEVHRTIMDNTGGFDSSALAKYLKLKQNYGKTTYLF